MIKTMTAALLGLGIGVAALAPAAQAQPFGERFERRVERDRDFDRRDDFRRDRRDDFRRERFERRRFGEGCRTIIVRRENAYGDVVVKRIRRCG